MKTNCSNFRALSSGLKDTCGSADLSAFWYGLHVSQKDIALNVGQDTNLSD